MKSKNGSHDYMQIGDTIIIERATLDSEDHSELFGKGNRFAVLSAGVANNENSSPITVKRNGADK